MSTLKVNNLQVGQNATATNNFTLYQPATPDGTVRLGYGNAGSVTDLFNIGNTGSVGIGTNYNGLVRLFINGPDGEFLRLRTSGDVSTTGYVYQRFNDVNGSAAYIGFGGTANTFSVVNYKNGPVQIQTSNVPRLTIDGSGNVGIGITNPSNSLQVVLSTPVSIPTAGTSGHHATIGDIAFGVAIGAINNGRSYLQGTRWDGSAINYDLLLQPNGGNVGIGTTNPTSALQVQGTGQFVATSSNLATSTAAIYANTPLQTVSAFFGRIASVTALTGDQYSTSIRFNGSDIAWGDLSYYPNQGGQGHFRFSLAGSSVITTPNAKVGVGDLYCNGKLGIGITGSRNVLDLGNATDNRGISWGGLTANYANIWTEYSSGSIHIGQGIRPEGTNTGWVSSYGGGSVGRSLIKMNFNSGDLTFHTASASTVADGTAVTVSERVKIDNTGRILSFNGGTPNSNVTSTSYAYHFDYVPSKNAWTNLTDASNNQSTHALYVRTPVLDSSNVDAIIIAESGGQASGRNSLTFLNEDQNAGTGYRKARLYTDVGPSYATTSFYIDVADSSLALQNRFKIDQAGRLTLPSQPSFRVYSPSGAVNTIITFGSTEYNIGGHMDASTGVFTAPIAGRYLFTFAILSGNPYGSYVRIGFCKNSTTLDTTLGDTLCDGLSTYGSPSMSMIFSLAANDTIRLRAEGSGVYGTGYGSFSGCLIG